MNRIIVPDIYKLWIAAELSVEKEPAIVCIYDANLCIRYCNDFGCRILGYPYESFIGTQITHYHKADDFEIIKKAFKLCRNTNGFEFRKVWINAKYKPVKTICRLRKKWIEGKEYFGSVELLIPGEQEADSFKESPVPQSMLEKYKKELIRFLIDEEKFLDTKISLTDTAVALKIPQKYLSYIINHTYHLNFNDFINYHRLLKLKAIKGEDNRSSNNDIDALRKAGFGSIATFYRAQKKFPFCLKK